MGAHYLLPRHVKFLKYSLDLIQELSHPHLTPKPRHKGAGEWRISLKYEPKIHQIEMQRRKGLRSHSVATIGEVVCFWSLASMQKHRMLHVISTLRLGMGTALRIHEHPSRRGNKGVLRERTSSSSCEQKGDVKQVGRLGQLIAKDRRQGLCSPPRARVLSNTYLPYLARGIQPTGEAAVGGMLQAQSALLFLQWNVLPLSLPTLKLSKNVQSRWKKQFNSHLFENDCWLMIKVAMIGIFSFFYDAHEWTYIFMAFRNIY